MARKLFRTPRNADVQIPGSLEIGVRTVGSSVGGAQDNTATDAYLKLPQLTTAQRNAMTAEGGMLVYDTTLDTVYVYNENGGWGSTNGTAAGSLDAAYNGGSSITVDAAAVALTSSLATAAFTIVGNSVTGNQVATITGTGVTTGYVARLAAVEATLTSGGYLQCYDGAASDFTIGRYGATVITGNAATDVLTLTAGHAVITSGNLTLSSGNVDVTGTLAVSSTSTLAAINNSGTITSEGKMIIDIDNAEALLVRRNGDAADVFAIDTTSDAGDTNVLITAGVTTGIGLHVDGTTVTTGAVIQATAVAATMTGAGALFKGVVGGVEVFAVRDDGSIYSKATAEGTTALQLVTGDLVVTDGDLTVSAGEVAFTSNANAAGVVIANNTITTANQLVGVSSTTISTGALMTLNANTAAHDGEVLEIISAGDATSTPKGVSVVIASPTTGAAFGLDITMVGATTGPKGIAVTMDALTEGNMLYLDNGGGTLTTGYYINCNDDGVSDFSVGADGATTITTAVATTAALSVTGVQTSQSMVTFDNTGGVQASDTAVLLLDAGGAVASGGNILRIAPTGTPNSGAIGVEFVGATKALTAVYIDADPTASDVMTVLGGGALTDNNGVLVVMSDGALASGGNTFRVETAGTPASGAIYAEFNFTGITDTNENVGLKIDAGGKKVQALHVDGDPIATDAAYIHSDAVIADNMAVLKVHSAGAIASGANTFRVETDGTPASGAIYAEFDYTGITDTNENIGFKIDAGGKKVIGLHVDADPIANDVAYIHSDAVIADNKAVLQVHSAGAVAGGGNVFRVEVDGTPASGAIYGEFDFTGITDTNENIGVKIDAGGKKVVGLHVDADPVANSAVYLTSGAALAADKATLEVVSVPTTNDADSAVVRLEQTHTAGGSNILHMVQLDIDKPFFGFETTVGTGNAVEAVAAKTLTTTHFVMVDLEGVGVRYFPIGTIA